MSPLLRQALFVGIGLGTLAPSSAFGQGSADAEPDDAGAQLMSTSPIASATRDKVERDLSDLLANPKLGFCRDPEIARAEANSTTCALAHAHARQRCPALEKACSAQALAP
ncbi:MAG TPA: hypothetical protein VNW92_02720, partial [Polyangiaceae bacterium]|nr:hypothetical protein [Polyangiaceae bacterium]